MAASGSVAMKVRKGGRGAGRRGNVSFNDRRQCIGGDRPQVSGGMGLGRGRGAVRDGLSGRRPGAGGQGALNKNRRFRPSQQQKVFAGSAKEGQGFALWRKQKVQLEYKKLLHKKKATASKEVLYTDNYPEHLKHLYLAEEERLRIQKKRKTPEEEPSLITGETETVQREKFKKKTSNQKAKEEYERVQRERAKKRQEAENNRKRREAAQQLYKKKKMEAYKILSTKTKKGQPNFNVQMEYLLKKIQSKP